MKKAESRASKRKADKQVTKDDGHPGESDGHGAGELPLQEQASASTDLPSGLQAALHERGPEMVDDMPLQGESGVNRCAVPECDLPGGHDGHHQDRNGQTFIYDLYEGRRAPTSGEKEMEEDSSSSSISEPSDIGPDSSDELRPAEEQSPSQATPGSRRRRPLWCSPWTLTRMTSSVPTSQRDWERDH